jgi:HlyD family type I secretion membrane fusion protein
VAESPFDRYNHLKHLKPRPKAEGDNGDTGNNGGDVPKKPEPSRNLPSVYRSANERSKERSGLPSRTGLKTMRSLTVLTDRMARPLESSMHAEDAASPDILAKKTIRIGAILAIILFGVIGLWSAFWPLATGAVAQGKVVVDTNRKTMQHLEGGIIQEILVRDGETVAEGQVLLRLDSTNASARRDAARGQYIGVKAAEARLIAERDGARSVVFAPELLALDGKDPEATKQMDTQRRLFATRRTNLNEQIAVLGRQAAQSNDEIRGLQEQVAAATEQLRLLQDEISMVETLVASGNAVKSRLLSLQRAAAQIQGQRGEAIAAISRAGQGAQQSRIEITNKKTEFLNQVIAELKETQTQASTLEEQLKSTQDVVRRIEVKAPLAGQIVGLMVHTVGGVIQPGEKLMDIVPTGGKMIVEAQISPQDIDAVHVGMPARLRITAYKQRYLRPLEGSVITVSADRFDDPQTGQAYYTARIEIPATETTALEGATLTPGMPAEVLIVTGYRTMLSYLFDPITQSFGRAFRGE